MNRRDLIRGTAGVIPASAAFTLLATKWADTAEAAQQGDFQGPFDVLNYALTLEYLEATYYKKGTEAVALDGEAAGYLETVQADEQAHVDKIKATIKKLGGEPVAPPEVDFGDAFSSADNFLTLAYTFENTGVGAYLGAAPALYEQKALLKAAASIYGVECRHAAILGNLLGKPAEGGVYKNSAFEQPLTRSEVLSRVQPFVAGMPGGGVGTGGGSTVGVENVAAFSAGGAALAGAGAAAYYAARRGTDEKEQA